MRELPTHSFGGYTLRPAGEADRELARAWNAVDTDHAWELEQPDYWTASGLSVNCYVLCRPHVLRCPLEPLFFFRMVRPWLRPDGEQVYFIDLWLSGPSASDEDVKRADWVEINIQFDRTGHTPYWNTMLGMEAGMKWLETILPVNGIHAVYFNSKNQRLIRFAEKRLGFVKDGERYKRMIEAAENCGKVS